MENPVSTNSALVTTGGLVPPNGSLGWNPPGGTDSRASPAPVRHRSTLRTSSGGTRTR